MLLSDKENSEKLSLLDLPNEILIQILYNFTTLPLLQLRSVNHRFQSLVFRIVHGRLLLAASLNDRKLILECYHPSAQYSEPYLYCDYLGTPGLSDRVPGQGSVFDDVDGKDGIQALKRLYSRFRPTDKDPQLGPKAPHPAGDIPGSRTSDAAAENSRAERENSGPVRRRISLESHENFSQLVFNTDLVQLGPRRGVFLDIMTVNEKKTLRIFRHWLASRVRSKQNLSDQDAQKNGSPDSTGEGREQDLVWIDGERQTAGLRLFVEENKWRYNAPILLHRDEDRAVAYSLELQELYISTIHLLLAIEQNILEKEQGLSKAMIFTTMRQ